MFRNLPRFVMLHYDVRCEFPGSSKYYGAKQLEAPFPCRQLLDGPPREEKDIKRQRAKLQRLRDKTFNHLTGRQVFLSDMLLRRNVGRHLKLHRSSARGIMKQHGQVWSTMSARKKAQYEVRASHLRQQKMNEVESALDVEVTTLQTLLHRERATEEEGNPQMHACRLSDDDLQQLHTLFHSDALPKSQILALRKQSLVCPEPLTHAEFTSMLEHGHLSEPIAGVWGPVATQLMRAREILQGKVIGVYANGEFS
eukprot:6457843-Amphidinium_carterae.2